MRKVAGVAMAMGLGLMICAKGVEAIAGQYFTAASHSLNNDLVGVDYKLTEEQQNRVIDQLQYSYLSKADLDESAKYLNTSTDRDIDLSEYDHDNKKDNKSTRNDQAVAKSYLLRNNILERRGMIRYVGGTNPFVFERCDKVYAETWEKQFEERRERLLEELDYGDLGKSAVMQKVSQLVDECLEDFGASIEEPEEDSEWLGLKRFKKKFKNAVDGVTGKAAVNAMAREYVDQITEYAKGFKQGYGATDNDTVTKTELLMLLSKASFGTKNSRPVVWNAPAVRNGDTYSQSTKDYWNGGVIVSNLGGYWDTGQFKGGANFETGDFYYYVSSNVYEEYLKDLLDRGIVYEDEFGTSKEAIQFLEDYEKFDEETPVWAASLGVCSVGVRNSLGSGYFFQENGVGLTMVCHHSKFFSDEMLTTMEIYQYVEDFLRVTEKDISETEASIVTYKYGLNYLAPYSGSQLRTLEFLIAKGILNFEDSSLFCDLTAPMSYSRLYQLVYRVAEKDARYDFSKVQLTDSENHWIAKGYAESDVSVVDSSTGFVSESRAEELEDDEVASVDAWWDTVYAEKKEFEVTYELTKDLEWFYDGTAVKTMESGENFPSTVLNVESGKLKHDGKVADVWKLRLSIAAESAKKAIKKADKHLTSSSVSGNSMPTVVKLTEKGKSEDPEEYTLIPQSAMRQNFSKISVLEDKVLVNVDTGCQAILFPDNGYALVGNTVVKTDGLLMEEAENEVYYNLKVIMSLVDNDFLKRTGLKVTVFHCSEKFKTYQVEVANEYDKAFKKATIATLRATEKMVVDEEVQEGDWLHYYKIDDLNEGLNTMIRKFSLTGAGDVWLIVDFNIVLPKIEEVTDEGGDIYKAITAVVSGEDNGDYDPTKILNAFYRRPEGSKVLEYWWDSNYIASNALINFMLGTRGIEYVTTGYLTPSLTLLGGSKNFLGAEDQWATKLFQGIEFTVYDNGTGEKQPDTEVLGYVGGGGSTWYKSFFSSTDFVEGLKMEEKEENLLSAMIAEYRTIDFFAETKVNKYGGHSFNPDFFLTNAGVLYRNVNSDYRVHAAVDLNGNMKGSSYAVRNLELVTRLPNEVKLKEDTNEVVSIVGGHKPDDKRKMLYRGTVTLGGTEYYEFTPVGKDVIRLGVTDKLYNGVYLAVEQDESREDFGKLSLVVDKGTMDTGTPLSSPRYGKLEDVFDRWAKEYLGDGCSYRKWEKVPLNLWCSFNDKLKKKSGLTKDTKHLYVNATSEAKDGVRAETADENFFKEFGEQVRQYFGNGYLDNALSLSNTLSHGEVFRWLGIRTIKGESTRTKEGSQFDLGARIGYSLADIAKAGDESKDWYKTAESGKDYMNESDSATSLFKGISDRPCFLGKKVNHFDGNIAIAVPNFYVPTDKYTVVEEEGEYKLTNGGIAAAFCLSNLYTPGILKSVQENIIAHSIGTTSLKELSAGDVVLIAGVRFFVDKEKGNEGDVWLTSAVLNLLETRNDLRTFAKTWRSEKDTKFTEEALKIIDSTMIRCDGKAYSLAGYLTKGTNKKGKEYHFVEVGGLKKTPSTKKKGLIYLGDNKVLKGYKGGKIKKLGKKDTGNYQYIRVRYSLDGELQARPLNSEKTVWILTNTTVSGNYGDGTNFFFYDEELDLSENIKSSIDVSTAWFNPSAAFLAVKSQFLKVHAQLFAKDFKTWLLMIICMVAIYLCVVSWLAYLILHYGVFHQLFVAIDVGPAGSNGTGFDVVKFFTFKMFTLDDDPPLHRIVVIQVFCIAVAAVCMSLV